MNRIVPKAIDAKSYKKVIGYYLYRLSIFSIPMDFSELLGIGTIEFRPKARIKVGTSFGYVMKNMM